MIAMNPMDPEYRQWGQHRHLDQKKWKEDSERLRNTDKGPHHGYPEGAHTTIGMTNVGWKHKESSLKRYKMECDAYTLNTDTDGEPVEQSEEDLELVRKKRELQLIEEQILYKKVAIALKKAEPFLQMKTFQTRDQEQVDFSQSKRTLEYENVEPLRENVPLKDRVQAILQLKHPHGYLFKAPVRQAGVPKPIFQLPKLAKSFVERMNASILSKDDLLKDCVLSDCEEEHPLKRRVKALMEQRHNPCVVPQTNVEADLHREPFSLSPTPTVTEQDSAARGFQRFLSVLNKGVDINLLTKIVNDVKELPAVCDKVPHHQPSTVEPQPSVSYRSESQGSRSPHSHSQSRERATEQAGAERANTDILRRTTPDDGACLRNDRGYSHHASRSRSKSPPAKQRRFADKEKQAQLQSLLQTIGLSLGIEEASQLTERTRERLSWTNDNEQRRESKNEHPRSSSTASSSGGSSPGSCRRQHSHKKASGISRGQRQTSKYSSSRERNRNRESNISVKDCDCADEVCDPDQTDPDRYMDHVVHSQQSTLDNHSYSQNQTYPLAYLAHALSTCTAAQYSQQTNHTSRRYGANASVWQCDPSATPVSPYPAGSPQCSQNNSYHFEVSVPFNPYSKFSGDVSLSDACLLFNPDLSLSEGQQEFDLVPRCLQVIDTVELQKNFRCWKMGNIKNHGKVQQTKNDSTKQKSTHNRQLVDVTGTNEVRKRKLPALTSTPMSVGDPKGNSERSLPVVENKTTLTEPEIKANLKKKLEEFNLKMKQKVAKSGSSI